MQVTTQLTRSRKADLRPKLLEFAQTGFTVPGSGHKRIIEKKMERWQLFYGLPLSDSKKGALENV